MNTFYLRTEKKRKKEDRVTKRRARRRKRKKQKKEGSEILVLSMGSTIFNLFTKPFNNVT